MRKNCVFIITKGAKNGKRNSILRSFVLVRCRPAVLLFTAMRFLCVLLAYFLRLELLL